MLKDHALATLRAATMRIARLTIRLLIGPLTRVALIVSQDGFGALSKDYKQAAAHFPWPAGKCTRQYCNGTHLQGGGHPIDW